MGGAITRVSVEAAAIVDGRCVRLRCLCGDLWGHADDEQVHSRASEIVRSLQQELLAAGLEPRAGLYQQ